MSVKFYADDHKYISIDERDPIDWISVTRLIHFFKEPFDTVKMAEACSKGKNPKYNKMKPEDIIALWASENKRAVNLGSWYHDQRERDLLACNSITREGRELTIVNPLMDGMVKLAPDQQLVEGIYPEHLVYLKSVGICGQADRIEIVNDRIDVYDYKTNKEIKMQSFVGKNGKSKKMLAPLAHLDECNYNEYALQLSTYMYIIQKHNFNLIPGKIQLDHVEFEIDHVDANGYPVIAHDAKGDPMVKKVTPYELPYMKKEVIAMFKYVQENREKILNHGH
jgi:hypothetical protein